MLTKILEQMGSIDLCGADPELLREINDISINTNLPKEERMQDYLSQIKNPYCFKCGKAIVKISFANTDITIEERMDKYLLSTRGKIIDILN